MFRLNEAVRRYQAQNSLPEAADVAASVSTLSPCSGSGKAGIVATVAEVATTPIDPTDLALLIEQLREEGVLLHHHKKALMVRPAHWHQMAILSSHWKAVLLFLQTNEYGDGDGLDQSA